MAAAAAAPPRRRGDSPREFPCPNGADDRVSSDPGGSSVWYGGCSERFHTQAQLERHWNEFHRVPLVSFLAARGTCKHARTRLEATHDGVGDGSFMQWTFCAGAYGVSWPCVRGVRSRTC
jgi:hypothetical protein